MASLRPRVSAIRPGSANTSCASLDTSFSLRAAGNETATAPLPAGERSMRISGRTGASASRSHDIARPVCFSTDDSGRFVNGLLAKIATEVRPEASSG